MQSDIYNYKILGSGNIVTNALLKVLWHKDITMEDFGEVCHFIISYFHRLEIDYKIGLSGMKPQIWFVPNDLDTTVQLINNEALNKYEERSLKYILKT